MIVECFDMSRCLRHDIARFERTPAPLEAIAHRLEFCPDATPEMLCVWANKLRAYGLEEGATAMEAVAARNATTH